MRILIANDDGIASPGLRLLADAAAHLTSDVWIVAPARKWTAASHQVSFDRDVSLVRRRERVYACDGAPADCVIGALSALFDAAGRPDLVLSGVNDRRNVGEDAAYSGTMAIAREATFSGVPAIALSRSRRWTDAPEEVAALGALCNVLWQCRGDWARDGAWLAVNLPDRLPARVVGAGVAHDKIAAAADVSERSADRVVYRVRRGRPGSATPGDENDVVDSGAIALVRHGWRATPALDDAFIEACNGALRQR